MNQTIGGIDTKVDSSCGFNEESFLCTSTQQEPVFDDSVTISNDSIESASFKAQNEHELMGQVESSSFYERNKADSTLSDSVTILENSSESSAFQARNDIEIMGLVESDSFTNKNSTQPKRFQFDII